MNVFEYVQCTKACTLPFTSFYILLYIYMCVCVLYNRHLILLSPPASRSLKSRMSSAIVSRAHMSKAAGVAATSRVHKALSEAMR